MVLKIARHLATVHQNKSDVTKFFDLLPNNIERKKIIETIRRNDNFVYNIDTNVNDGKLLVCKRPQKLKWKAQKTIQLNVRAKCEGFFVKSSIKAL